MPQNQHLVQFKDWGMKILVFNFLLIKSALFLYVRLANFVSFQIKAALLCRLCILAAGAWYKASRQPGFIVVMSWHLGNEHHFDLL